jgi:predicted helicase
MPDFCWCVFANGCQRVSAGIYGRDAKKYEQIKQNEKWDRRNGYVGQKFRKLCGGWGLNLCAVKQARVGTGLSFYQEFYTDSAKIATWTDSIESIITKSRKYVFDRNKLKMTFIRPFFSNSLMFCNLVTRASQEFVNVVNLTLQCSLIKNKF